MREALKLMNRKDDFPCHLEDLESRGNVCQLKLEDL